jgi:hypothetical protein
MTPPRTASIISGEELRPGELKMTGETESQPEESRERGETSEGREDREEQSLEDATLNPGVLIEQSGDIRQAEDVQEGLTSLVENAGDLTVILPPIPDGAFMPPLVTDYSVKLQPEDSTVIGSQPPIRGDLDQVAVTGTETMKGDEATPITLPGPQGTTDATPITLPEPRGIASGTGTASAGSAATGDAGGIGTGGVGSAATGDVRETASAGSSATGDAGGTGTGRVGSAATGDVRETASAGSSATGDAGGTGTGRVGSAATGDVRETGSAGSSATDDASGIASESVATRGKGTETSSEMQQTPVEYADEPTPPPPDMERRGAETDAGPEGGGARVMSAIPLAGAENAVTADTLAAESGSLEQPDQALEGGEQGQDGEADFDTTAAPVDESGELEANEETLGEGEEGWNPPPMYAHVDSSGTVTIVDENGKPIDSPPTVTKVVGEDGTEKYMASYEAGGKTYSFEVTSYISSLSDLYVGYDKDGKLTVFNGKGEPVDSPPVITKFVDEKGMEKYTAYYPGAGEGGKVTLSSYTASLEGCYSTTGQDGKVTIVDADGNPLKCQPVITKTVDHGIEKYYASYPGTGAKVELSAYSASLEGYYAHVGPDGKITVVGADGNPLKCQPVITKTVDHGVEIYYASYPGTGAKVELSAYSASLDGYYTHIGQDGKVTVVDADGNPVSSQPAITKTVDHGVEKYYASYPGTGAKVELSAYSASLEGYYAHVGPDGKITVVGADGKPLASQPLTYKFVDNKGVEQIVAYYPGDATKTTMTDYLPPSGKTKSGGSV